MTAEVQTTCPGCKRTLNAPFSAVEKPIRCGGCWTVLRIKRPLPRLVPPPLVKPCFRWKALLALGGVILAVAGAAANWSHLRPALFRAPPADNRDGAAPRKETPPPAPKASVPPKKAGAAESDAPNYARDILPLVNKYCIRCHGTVKPKGGVSLDHGKKADDARHRDLWEKVADNLRTGEMPPAGAKRPSAAEMEVWNRWLDGLLKVDCNGLKNPGRVTIRRLNRTEYNNTIRDLVGVNFQPGKDFPADDVGYGFDNIGDVLSIPPLLMEKYLAAAEQVVEAAMKSPDLRRRLLPQGGRRNRSGMSENLKQFATRAYRRPATESEVKRLLRFVQMAREQGDSSDTGAKLALQAVLVSPHFLFRVELDRQGKQAGPIGPWELASRLSYFLWASMPDEELFRLAREDKLHQPPVIEAQVKRMLKDPKARSLADNFASQWLNIRGLAGFNPDPKRFPTWNPDLRQAMLRETEMFFLHVLREDRSILDFIDGDYTFLNSRLAKHYGIANVKGEDFRKVSLAGTQRGGILTHASVLAVTSNPTRTSPVKRGKWILDNILGTPPPPPPPDVDELKEGNELKGTLRQQMEQHRKNPTCAACHQRMDPLGFGFENFDAIGSWRTKDGRYAIDPSGVLPDGSTFKGPADLRKILMNKKDLFAKCLTEKLLTYALGRGVERTDRCFIDQIAKDIAKDDYKFTRLIIEIVKSDPFQKRRAKGAPK